jgi:hypothetical protein
VGFDIAYPRAIGNARALVSGIGKVQIPTLFLLCIMVLWLLVFGIGNLPREKELAI